MSRSRLLITDLRQPDDDEFDSDAQGICSMRPERKSVFRWVLTGHRSTIAYSCGNSQFVLYHWPGSDYAEIGRLLPNKPVEDFWLLKPEDPSTKSLDPCYCIELAERFIAEKFPELYFEAVLDRDGKTEEAP